MNHKSGTLNNYNLNDNIKKFLTPNKNSLKKNDIIENT